MRRATSPSSMRCGSCDVIPALVAGDPAIGGCVGATSVALTLDPGAQGAGMTSEERPVKPSDILRNNVKEKLARGEVVSSMTVRLVRGIEIARIAKTAGFNSIYVDLEHSSLSLDETGQICMAALEMGLAPFVRVPSQHAGIHLARARRRRARHRRAQRALGAKRRAPSWRRRSIRRSAAAARRARCRSCTTAVSRPPRPTRLSTPRPW